MTTGEVEGPVTLTAVDPSGFGSVDFTVDSPDLAALVVLKGSAGSNIYDYSGFAGGGVASDDGLQWVSDQGSDNQVIFCLAEEQTESEPQSQPQSEPEGSVGGGTGTPAASVPNTAMSLGGFGGPLATLVFGLILLGSLGALAYANVAAVRRRS